MSPRSLIDDIAKIDEVSVNLLLTRRCNYACNHCMFGSGPKMPKDQMRWDDLEAIRMFLNELGEYLPSGTNFTINLVGGEPTLDMAHLKLMLDIIERWDIQGNYEDGGYRTPTLEMTTNGWWLASHKTTLAFAQATWRLIAQDRLRVRISNSVYHDAFRAERIKGVFRDEPGNRLAEHLENLMRSGEEENYEDWVIAELIKSAEKYHIYVDSKQKENKVSPVGRAKTSQIGWQDGHCHPTIDVKFTFMPTKDGEKPGRIYDVCCNGGKIALGHADMGLELLLRRMIYIADLHKEHPIREDRSGFNPNPGGGERCRACPGFGAKWLKNRPAEIEEIIVGAFEELRRRKELPELAEAA